MLVHCVGEIGKLQAFDRSFAHINSSSNQFVIFKAELDGGRGGGNFIKLIFQYCFIQKDN